jgi:hypothetical protein
MEKSRLRSINKSIGLWNGMRSLMTRALATKTSRQKQNMATNLIGWPPGWPAAFGSQHDPAVSLFLCEGLYFRPTAAHRILFSNSNVVEYAWQAAVGLLSSRGLLLSRAQVDCHIGQSDGQNHAAKLQASASGRSLWTSMEALACFVHWLVQQ